MSDDESLVAAVLAASRALVAIAAVSIEAAPVAVTLNQYRALVVLATRGPQRMSDLAGIMKLSRSSTTRMVERLERKGLAGRQPSPSSRRVTDLHLSALGSDVVAHVMAVRSREIAAVLEAVPAPQREAIKQAFQEFAIAAGEADPATGLVRARPS